MDWFFDLKHREAWERCVRMDAEGEAVDQCSYSIRFKDWELPSVCTGLLPHDNIDILLDPWAEHAKKFQRRRAAIQASRILDNLAIDENEDPKAIIEQIEKVARLSTRIGGNGHLPPMEDLFDSLALNHPEPPMIVEGLLHVGSKITLGGSSKSHKTWIMMHLAMCVATGTDWLGMKTTKSKVCYINFEIPVWSFDKRIRMLQQAMGLKVEPGMFTVWHLRGKSAGYDKIIPKLRDELEGKGFGLIVLDPIYKLYGEGVDENKAGDIAKVLNALEELAIAAQAGLIFGAHFSKGNKAMQDPMDRISGSGVFARDPDCVIAFTAHEKEEHFAFEPTLRNLKPMKPFVVKWECPLMVVTDEDPNKLRTKPGRPSEHTPEQVLAVLTDPMTNKEWMAACEDQLDMSRSAFIRHRDVLKGKGCLAIEKGKWVTTGQLPF